MDKLECLSHAQWECKYHVVFIPTCRRQTSCKELRKLLGEVFKQLPRQKESAVEEGDFMPDQALLMLSIPPKYSGS